MALQVGDKVWVDEEDGVDPAGWAVWTGTAWVGPCGELFTAFRLAWWLLRCPVLGCVNYEHMAEQMFADGSMDWPQRRLEELEMS